MRQFKSIVITLNKKKNSPVTFDIQSNEIAHNIRNMRNNQRVKQSRLYPKNQISLFNKELFSIPQSYDTMEHNRIGYHYNPNQLKQYS